MESGLRLDTDSAPFKAPFFDDDSEMHCGECGYDGRVYEFDKGGSSNVPEQLEFGFILCSKSQ